MYSSPPLTASQSRRIVAWCAERVSLRTGFDEEELRAEGTERALRFMREWSPALRVAPWRYLRRRLLWALYDCTKTSVRRQRFHGPLPGTETITRGMWSSGVPAPEDRVLAEELLARLPPRERRVMTLRFWAGADNGEIAAELEVSVCTVERAIASSLARMRKAA